MSGSSILKPSVISPLNNYADSISNRNIYDVQKSFFQLTQIQILNGVLISSVTIEITKTLIPHKLTRPFNGWFIVDTTSNADVFRDATATENLSIYLPLIASAQTIVSLWVF